MRARLREAQYYECSPTDCKCKLEGTHGVRTHAVLLLTLTLTFDLSTQSHTQSKISQDQVWTLWDHSFLSYASDICVKKMHLLTLSPWSLTFEYLNSITSRISRGHSLYQVWTLWDHSFVSYAADKQRDRQTNKQTDGRETPIHADRQSRCG